ncbi:MAG: pantoate--beta-alanine ligase [Planctomycetota bacterium]
MTRGAEVRQAVLAHRAAGRQVGLVPTMGALHAGHLSLVQAARRDGDVVVATVFVNPTQFAPGEDLARYPRDLESDCGLLAGAGCDLVFAPSIDEMYPQGSEIFVEVGAAATPWEGAARPTHFRGVATVVLKLFNLAPADVAYFGQKDYQQTVVIRRMVADLNVPIEIQVCPIVREPDGLAMSSRNVFLASDQRPAAVSLSASLDLAAELHAGGERSVAVVTRAMRALMTDAGAEVQYVAALRPGTVDEVFELDAPAIFAVAAKVGQTRLIDNALIG